MLLIYDFGTSLFLISKGLPGVKIHSFLSLLRMYPKIKIRHKILAATRKLSDKDMVENFADEVDVPPNLMGESSSQFFNSIVRSLSKKTKNIIHNS